MVMTDQEILAFLATKQKERRQTYQKEYHKTYDHKSARRAGRIVEKQEAIHRPFIGVDGEGAGNGLDHIYWLLRVGDMALWHEDGSELGSIEILKWLADLGAQGYGEKFIPVAYFFDYDTTMILRHLPEKNLKELMYDSPVCVRKSCKHHKNSHVKGYRNCFSSSCKCGQYLRGGQTTVFLGSSPDYIRISVQHRQLKVGWNNKPYFTITDVADLFQTSFLKTLGKWQHVEGAEDLLTDEEMETIRVNKDRRGDFQIGFDLETFDYNALECKLLAELMARFRSMCYANGIYPDMWTGPGRLAEDIFKSENVPQRTELDIPAIIEQLGDFAYYGGRMEGIHFGAHKDVIAYDIASAYPHAYTMLPCLLSGHGSWEEIDFDEVVAENLQNTLVVGSFEVNNTGMGGHPRICGLPMRDKRGGITFPTFSYGVWWWPEVREAIALYKKENVDYTRTIDACFTWRQTCSDSPGSFTSSWFQKRIQVGKSTRGIPIKLALNSLYGKAAQRVGAAKWADVVWAGLLTSITRARLLEATNILHTKNIISYQTDGIFCRGGGNDLRTGAELGDWEVERYPELFLIQSGVYSAVDENGVRSNKTRGMRDFEFRAAYDDIVRTWEDKKWTGAFDLPQRNAFVTIKLGLMWGKPHLIGTWCKQDRSLSFFANSDKREIWELNSVGEEFETTDGTTYAPGLLHRLMKKLEYGPHPFNDRWKEVGQEERFGFTYPYSREISMRLSDERKEAEVSYSFITPDEPYVLEEG
jgi:DNA polymerase type B, organellar and viral